LYCLHTASKDLQTPPSIPCLCGAGGLYAKKKKDKKGGEISLKKSVIFDNRKKTEKKQKIANPYLSMF